MKNFGSKCVYAIVDEMPNKTVILGIFDKYIDAVEQIEKYDGVVKDILTENSNNQIWWDTMTRGIVRIEKTFYYQERYL